MKGAYLKRVVSLLIIVLSLESSTKAPSMFAAASDPTILQAKKEAEAKGYIFFTTHDEIVAMAKKEAKLKVSSGLDSASFKPLIEAFKQKYPFITDTYVEEIRGREAHQRFILEIKSGQAKGWDITHISIDFGKDYLPYLMKHDILGMAKHGVLKIHPGMIHPVEGNILSVTSAIRVVAYNRKLIPEDKVPDRWEDFLKPEFKGKKFVLDIQPSGVSGLVPAWGLERTLDFARKLAAQQPVWGSGSARATAAVAAGEYPLYWGPTFGSIKRAVTKDPTGSLGYKIIEPAPTIILYHASGMLKTADHPHAALLWLEFLASPAGQEIIDKYDTLRASVFTPSSAAAQVIRGKELSVVDWNHFTRFQEYDAKIVMAYGLPKSDK